MAQLKHFLSGLSCRYLGGTSRGARAAAGLLAGKTHERRRKHLQRCPACRARQLRERQYLERLRGAAVPAASEDLTARLLARTGQLAAGDDGREPARASAPPAAHAPAPLRPQLSAHRAPAGTPLRLAVGLGGALAAGAVLLGGAAYLLGADATPAADAAFAPAAGAAFTEPLSALSVQSVSGAAWKLSGEPDVAPAGALSSEQLAALRAQGWSCPELRELGYHLVWARGGVAAGSAVLELRLTDGQHFATVLEQHGDSAASVRGAGGTGAAGPAAVPVNVLTGHPASEDGFKAAPAGTAPSSSAQPGLASPAGTLWVNRQAPFRAIYRTPSATFTYISESPAEQADDGVDALVRSRPAASPAPHGGDGVQNRLELGLQRLAELLAR